MREVSSAGADVYGWLLSAEVGGVVLLFAADAATRIVGGLMWKHSDGVSWISSRRALGSRVLRMLSMRGKQG